jgi:ornithine decarboxylase
MIRHFSTADAALSALRSPDPLLLLHLDAARAAARAALKTFPGSVAYAVKVCDTPEVLEALAEGGIRTWDVASVAEMKAVRAVQSDAELHYMNPVKSREHLAEAYAMGVRVFAFDCDRELAKIAEMTQGDRSVLPVVRIAVPNDSARLALDGKFGCGEDDAARLMRLAVDMGYGCGVTFHVGSQCEVVDAWGQASALACRAALRAGIVPAMFDIGGGFPARYRGHEPDFAACVGAAKAELDRFFPGFDGIFQCEPGRLLAASSASALVRVELRKEGALFLNEGYYGLLAELKWMTGVHPVRRMGRECGHENLSPFTLYGPTCDSIDAMEGPYWLPDGTDEGDWIEIGMIGAYSTVLRTGFNGFAPARTVVIGDLPAIRLVA